MTRPDDAREPDDHAGAGSDDLEAPAADTAEQATSAVGEWDAVEQAIVVDLEDEYDH